jgi:hypothetical protein
MLERTIEAALVRRVKELGGLCEKFVSPGRRSVPDRIVTLLTHEHGLVRAVAKGVRRTRSKFGSR